MVEVEYLRTLHLYNPLNSVSNLDQPYTIHHRRDDKQYPHCQSEYHR